MMWWIRNLFFAIKYKLGLAREGIDFIDADFEEVIYE